MHIVKAKELGQPIENPKGEKIFELIGKGGGVANAEQHSLALIELPQGGCSDKHFHRVLEESYYILSGEAKLVVNGDAFVLKAGDACLLSPLDVHQIFNEESEPLKFLAVCVPPWQPEDSYMVDA